MAATAARRIALTAIEDVESRQEAATVALHRRMPPDLPLRERAFATELVYGSVRWRDQLDWLIDGVTTGGRHRPQPVVRLILRIAAYELCHLRSTRPSASCHQAVELARERAPKAVAFVNAVCRRLAAIRDRFPDDDSLWPPVAEDAVRHLAVRYSHPYWLVQRWFQRFGFDEARQLLAANNETPPLTLRVNRLRCDREQLAASLTAAGLEVEPTRYSPDGLIVDQAPGGVSRLPGFDDGWFVVQDESSQLVAWAVGPKAGERVLDMCSAPGGKTTHLAALMGDEGEVVALDSRPDRLVKLEANRRRLGMESIVTRALDAAHLDEAALGSFDRVLLDAPCSGLGVLRRRADARWRKRPEDLAVLPPLQARLLDQGARAVKPGGILVYCTCSTEPEETTEQVAGFLQRFPNFYGDPLAPVLPPAARALLEPSAWHLYLYPHRHRTDGFFIARLRRRR